MTFTHRLVDAHERIFPTRNKISEAPLVLDAARGERLAFQAAVSFDEAQGGATIAFVGAKVNGPGLKLRTRRVGFVPVAHLNTNTPADECDILEHVLGFVPDPLFDENTARLASGETVICRSLRSM